MRKFYPIVIIAIVLLPAIVQAHGFVADGHDGSLRLIDYIELGAITLGSIGLLVYSFRQYKNKDKK